MRWDKSAAVGEDLVLSLAAALLDLNAPVQEIATSLEAEPKLAPLVRRWPGVRIPGTVDPFELSVRAVLGQQISVAGASRLASRVAERWGASLGAPSVRARHSFPGPAELLDAELESVGISQVRATAIRELAACSMSGTIDLLAGPKFSADAEEKLLTIRGIGPWTASYIGLRALGNRDAIPTSDLGLRQALGGNNPCTPHQVTKHAAAWRPWRGYAAMYLWGTYLDTGTS